MEWYPASICRGMSKFSLARGQCELVVQNEGQYEPDVRSGGGEIEVPESVAV